MATTAQPIKAAPARTTNTPMTLPNRKLQFGFGEGAMGRGPAGRHDRIITVKNPVGDGSREAQHGAHRATEMGATQADVAPNRKLWPQDGQFADHGRHQVPGWRRTSPEQGGLGAGAFLV